jgi:hypothetical protein
MNERAGVSHTGQKVTAVFGELDIMSQTSLLSSCWECCLFMLFGDGDVRNGIILCGSSANGNFTLR